MKPNTEIHMLDDRTIRAELKQYLSNCSNSPRLIVDEISVHNGNARADLVAFYKEPYCFEIKSDKDTFYRLERQSAYYDFTFKRNILVTTTRLKEKATNAIPSHWGLLIVDESKTLGLKFSWIRRPKANKNWHSEKALLTLWRSELIDLHENLSQTSIAKSASRTTLASKLGREIRKKDVQSSFFQALYERYASGDYKRYKFTARKA